MLAGMSLGTEIRRYSRGTLPRIAVITMVLLPLLYGALYLWAFWNPFGEVNKMPAAVVNLDEGAVNGGKKINAGDQVAAALKSSGQLNLTEMSAEDARRGVADGKYYFSITLPEDFSAAVVSPNTANPHKALLQFTFNDANSYLASVIGQNAAREVLAKVGDTIGQQSVDQVLVGLTTAGKGIDKASAGAKLLATNLATADSAAQQLASGSKLLADNLATARDGSAQLQAGSAELAAGVESATGPLLGIINQLQSSGVKPSSYVTTAQQLSTELSPVLDSLSLAGSAQGEALRSVRQIITFLKLDPNPAVRNAAKTLAPVEKFLSTQGLSPQTTARIDGLKQTSTTLTTQLSDPGVTSMLSMLESGDLTTQVTRLRDGSAQLKTGIDTLAGGLTQLAAGGTQLADGAGQLAAGTPQLKAGAEQLAAGLADGAKQVPKWSDQQRIGTAQTLSSPVALDMFHDNEAPNFGSGFAPFFMTLALFIGAMLIWMILKPLQSRPIVNGVSAIRTVLSSYWPALLIAVGQGLVMYLVVHFGLGLDVAHVAGAIAFVILIGATYLAIIQMFNAIFGIPVGRVLTLAFLMVQMVSSGGIYPVETTARPFQILHPFDPMTYAVNGMRQLINGGVDERLPIAVAVLLGLLLAALAVSSWAARRNRVYTMDRLYPPIEV